MKISIKNILLLGIISIFYISCNKDELSSIEPISTSIFDDITFIKNPIDISHYISNSEDKDDEKISKYLLEIGIAATEVFKDKSYNKMILSTAKNNANSCTNLKEFIKMTETKSSSKAFSHLISSIEKADLTHLSNNPLKSGVIENYIPAIFVPNSEIADYSKQALISPVIEVNSELPGAEGYENYIIAWYYDKEVLHEILIDEEMAMSTTHPIFIIDNAEEMLLNMEKSIVSKSTNSEIIKSAVTDDTDFAIGNYKLKRRCESSGDSEYCITAFRIDGAGNIHQILYSGSYYNPWKQIASVSKSNINNFMTITSHFCSQDVTPFDENYIFWNTYERDWYKSDKSLGDASRNGVTVYLTGKRRYTTDWYAFDPDDVNSNPFSAEYCYNYNTVSYTSDHSDTGFKKWNY